MAKVEYQSKNKFIGLYGLETILLKPVMKRSHFMTAEHSGQVNGFVFSGGWGGSS
jgi:hypothetical protein